MRIGSWPSKTQDFAPSHLRTEKFGACFPFAFGFAAASDLRATFSTVTLLLL